MNKQLNYFLKNFQLFYDTKNIEVEYSIECKGKLSIFQNCNKDFWEQKQDINPKFIVWKEWKKIKIPFLFEKDNTKEIITYEKGKAIINYDIVASTFYFLSGWNEYVNSSKDEFGRVNYKNSIIKKLNIVHIPVVNYYFDILFEAIKEIYKRDVRKHVWGDKSFVVSLTHDIDTCRSAWLEGSFSELKKKKILSIPKLVFKRFFKKDDWFNFNTIIDIEKSYGALSSFYFLPQKGKVGSWKNADYNILSKSIKKAILNIKNNDCEVGVHGSFGTHISSDRLNIDIKRINSQQIIGNRFHFLMFDSEKTPNVLENCDIKYDTSLGFAEQIGFRRGTCYPFYLWNFEKNRISTVLEIPLIVMDGTLANKKYMGVSRKETLPKVFNLIDEIAKFNGVFTLLWHNTYFSDFKYTGWKDIYCEILKYSKSNEGLLTKGEHLYRKVKGNE